MRIVHLVLALIVACMADAADSKSKTAGARTGKVVDSEGRPVAGAAIEAYQRPVTGSAGLSEWQLTHQTTSRSDGQFELPEITVPTAVIVKKQGLSFSWDYVAPQASFQPEEMSFCLTSPLSISGLVVDETDKGVPEAEIFVSTAYLERSVDGSRRRYCTLISPLGQKLFSCRSDSAGQFRLEGFPTDAGVDLQVISAGKVQKVEQRSTLSPDTMPYRSGQKEVKLVLEPGCVMEGKIVSKETGAPVKGMRIFAQNRTSPSNRSTPSVVSDADGKFKFPSLTAGSYSFQPQMNSYGLKGLLAESVSATLQTGETKSNIQIDAVEGGYIAVSAKDSTAGKPLDKVRINASKSTFSASALTDENGRALLYMTPGDYSVSAYQQGQDQQTQPLKATVTKGQTNQMEFKLVPPPTITITVKNPNGTPAANIPLLIMPTYYYSTEGRMTTDAKGQYQFKKQTRSSGLSGVKPCIVARDLDRKLAASAELIDDETKVELRLEPSLTIVGKIEDQKRKPLSGAFVNVTFWTGNMGMSIDQKPSQTDADGRFEVVGLPQDHRYTVSATAPGYGSASKSLQADETHSKRLELKPFELILADKEIRGMVVDENDKPVASANVHIYGDNQPNLSVRSDENGRFTLKVCEGMVRLSASTPGSRYGNTTAEAGDTNVIIAVADSSSSSRVRPVVVRSSLKGKPMPDLASAGLDKSAVPSEKAGLLCLFDCEQRPSRRVVRLLGEQTDSLKQKGLSVAAIQAIITTEEAFKNWKDSAPLPFPAGRIAEKTDKTKWAIDVQSLPWLILFDKTGKVVDEGFSLDELESKLKKLE